MSAILFLFLTVTFGVIGIIYTLDNNFTMAIILYFGTLIMLILFVVYLGKEKPRI